MTYYILRRILGGLIEIFFSKAASESYPQAHKATRAEDLSLSAPLCSYRTANLRSG
jgi:hypothetical protein